MAFPGTIAVAQGVAQSGANSGTVTWNHTVAAEHNKIAFLIGTGMSGGADPVTGSGVSYNSVQLSAVSGANASDGNFERGQIWHLNSPATGTNVCSVAYSAGSAVQINGFSISFEGASASVGTPSTNTGTSANPTVTCADSANGDVVIGILVTDGSASTTTPSGTQIGESEDISSDSDQNAQYVTATGANTVISWTNSTSGEGWVAIAVAIKNASAASYKPRGMLMGIG